MQVMTSPAQLSQSSKLIINCIMYSVLAGQTYDWLSNLPFEVEFIWSKPHSSVTKWSYLFSRYLGLMGQIINTFFRVRTQSSPSIPGAWCHGLHGTLVIPNEGSLFALNLTLMQRIAVLYSGRPDIMMFLKIIVALTAVAGGIWSFVLSQRLDLVGPCLVRSIHPSATYLAVLHLGVQGILWSLTIFKWDVRISPSIIRRITRDMSRVWTASFVIYAGLMANTQLANLNFNMVIFNLCVFPLSTAMLVFGNCYIVVGMELKDKEPQECTDVQLTLITSDEIDED